MKINWILVLISLGISAFAGYGFFSGTGNMLLTVGSGVFLFATLLGMFGISFGRGSANIKIFSGIFLVLALVEHLIFVFSGFRQTAYIVITGILFLLYLLIFYGIVKALKEE
ncbi:hypothetical protein ABH09_10550 [Treponema sp. OMZ 803]|jgi:hypothetical protein|uniref:hypothetical protein n=1 Tax=Treponema sp. OMZ 803 TaxID=120682 RepID=UPI0020A380D5|nr:hypothetical protein [Treponema sp. OMZ 803]UTC52766.1 hypothetical protein ABH09_10550 [Treponema sp. OMZ 803]